MTLLIDANIILDVLQKREPHYRCSSIVWKLCEVGKCRGYISTLTFANLVYIMRKELSPEQIGEVLRSLRLIFTFADLSATDIGNAADKNWDDFEDAVQSSIAERIKADYIITRNGKDFCKSRVVALTPGELLARIE